MSRNACFTETAVLASSRLDKVTGSTLMSGMEDDMIIRISLQFFCVILWCDKRLGDNRQIE